MTTNNLNIWLETARPKTLPLALATILTGSALASRPIQLGDYAAVLADSNSVAGVV